MSKMFRSITRTWNPFVGCGFACTYCWAHRLAEGKLKKSYPNGFVPEFHPERLKVKFKPNDFVFVSSMGDISFAGDDALLDIIHIIERYPQTHFLVQTKAPSMFTGGEWPSNVVTGATIETNREIPVSKAPHPRQRALDMMMNQHPRKFLSIEPVMDFDLDVFATWIMDIEPEIVEIGADNYNCGLLEPSWDKVEELIDRLERIGIQVKQKDGLERLRG